MLCIKVNVNINCWMTQSYSVSLVVSDSISPCSTIKEIIFIAAGQEKPMMQGFGLKVHCVKILRNYVDNRRLDETYHILGDSAYPLSNHLLTPYRVRQNMSLAQKKYNTNLALKRSVIERAFVLLGLRFPRLMKLKVKSLDKRIKCIVSACVLHNWCIFEDDCCEESFDEYIANLDTDVNTLPATAILGRRRALGGGMTKRDMLCNYIDSKV